MRLMTARLTGALVATVAAAIAVGAQGHASHSAAHAASDDPRVGLKAGLHNAGSAIRNLELVANLPKPAGFFDPKAPAGLPTGPEIPESAKPADPNAKPTPAQEAQIARLVAGLNFANSDLAFSGTHLFVGNFNGFNIYDIGNPAKPKLVTSVVCPGGQGDLSVHGTLLVMSVEQTRGRIDCGTQGVEPPVSRERFRGVRIFDLKNLKKPVQVAAVQTCRGSHTHTLVSNPKDPGNLYVYGSGTSAVRANEELAGCSGGEPKDDPNTALFSIDVIQIPVAAPQNAKVVSRPRIFADAATGSIAGLWPGGAHGPGTQKTSVTNQCHDITVFPEVGLAAGACSGNGILLDISDPVKPVRLDQVVDKNFAYWHSATFNNDGSKVIFTDEWGGGTRPRCRATDLPTWGADAIFEIVDRQLKFAGYYKLPAPQTEQENCVAHNGSLVPVPGRDIMVQAWYQGGVSMFDFTDAAKPVEIAFFDRGPLSATELMTGGFWSTYWYNGHIYGTEMARGIDIFRLKASEFLSQHEIDAARLAVRSEFNAQQQPKVTWPATPVVARAYLDQLLRTRGIAAERSTALKSVLDRAERVKAGDQDAAVADALTSLAATVAKDAGPAAPIDAARLRALAVNLEGQAARLR